MVNKYIDVSAPNNGDGTISGQAAIDGGNGAWNSLISVLQGTPGHGSLDPGDVVYVRTYNGGNLSETLTASITISTGATQANPITFIFDNGTVWPTGGTMKITQASTYSWTWEDNIIFKADYSFDGLTDTYTSGFKFEVTSNSQMIPWHSIRDNIFIGIEFDGSNYPILQTILQKQYGSSRFIGCYFNNSANNGGMNYGSFAFELYCRSIHLGCIYDARNQDGTAGNGIVSSGRYNDRIEVYGGKVVNTVVGANFISNLAPDYRNSLTFGTAIINGINLNGINIVGAGSRLAMNNYINSVMHNEDCYYADGCGEVDFSRGKNYPTLNAQLSDNTYWSYRCLPSPTVNTGYPLQLPRMNVEYTGSDAIVTAKMELLIKDTSSGSGAFNAPTNQHFWAIVSYVESASGIRVTKRTPVDRTALSTSAAGWSTTTYNGDSYNKYKIEITTPTAVKQNTWVYADVYCSVPRIDIDDYFFVDPEVVLV